MVSWGLSVLGLLAVAAYRRHRWSLRFNLLLSLGIFACGVYGLWHGASTLLPGGLLISPLRAWFLLLLGLVASLSSWYRWGYHDDRPSVRFWLPLFVVSMTTVILANNLWVFMTGWESMTMTSFLLVITHHQRPGVLKSGYIYLVMSQLSAMLILAGFMVMGTHLQSDNFSVWAQHAKTLPMAAKSVVFGLLGLGFGMKSGVIPFHVWLPRAHPVAPAPVSSLMSGAMIKLGMFGMMQFLLFDLGPTARFWPLLMLAVGAASSLLGVLYALMEQDLKRFLAYSSIENMGIILLGAGVMGVGMDWHRPALTAVGLVAALFHMLNHALFKSQLFLAAGAVEQHTGSLQLDHLGGLVRTIPGIALGFMAGSMAISALPPFNGFVSEWLTFRGLLGLVAHGTGLLAAYGLGLALVLGLTGALAALGFVKASGVIFLGEPRQTTPRHPVPVSLTAPILGLAAITLVLGAVPQPILHLLSGLDPAYRVRAVAYVLPLKTSLIAALLVLGVALFAGLSRVWAVRTVPRWSCGREADAAMQYTAASFTKSIRTTFAMIYRPHRHVVRLGPDAPDFPTRLVYRGGTVPVWERYVYRPMYGLIWRASRLSTRVQRGPVRLYLVYVLGTVGFMLALLH